MSERRRKAPPMTGNIRVRAMPVAMVLKAKPFKLGVADYHAGKWTEVRGLWRGVHAAGLYEAARLACAATGARVITADIFLRARIYGAIPSATQPPAPRPTDRRGA